MTLGNDQGVFGRNDAGANSVGSTGEVETGREKNRGEIRSRGKTNCTRSISIFSWKIPMGQKKKPYTGKKQRRVIQSITL